MAFATPLSLNVSTRNVHSHPAPPPLLCTLSSPRSRPPHHHQPKYNKPHKSVTAPVVDARVASRHEIHHWVTVMNHSRRVFERAAVAQADLIRRLEASHRHGVSAGAMHRWVLREHAHPASSSPLFSTCSRYLCAESYEGQFSSTSATPTRRWLAAVERVGPLISTIDAHSRAYNDVFTAKVHDVTFNPRKNVVLISTYNTHHAPEHVHVVANALTAKAERVVSNGTALESSVLHASQNKLFKTVEVFATMDALSAYLEQQRDVPWMKFLKPHLVAEEPTRHVFTPVVFS